MSRAREHCRRKPLQSSAEPEYGAEYEAWERCADEEAKVEAVMAGAAGVEELKQTPHLNVVLLGKDPRSKKPSKSSSMCVKQKEVSGHQITLVEMPALYKTQLTEREVMHQTFQCVSTCDPGVHAFIIILPEGPLTDEDRVEIEMFQRIFSSRVNDHTIFIISQQSRKKALEEYLQSVTKTIGGRFEFFSSEINAKTLFPSVKNLLKENNNRQYTMAMYAEAQFEAQLKYKHEIKTLQQVITGLKRNRIQTQDLSNSPDTLRIVLLGKTGVGKSASGNTILRKNAFKEILSSESITTRCQKETAEIRGRQITVIDTPGLFDTEIDNDEIRKEIVKCISMAAPGPHVFLLMLKIGDRFTKEEMEAVKIIEKTFGETSNKYTIILFTRADELKTQTIEEYIKTAGTTLKTLLFACGNRYHVFNNRDKSSNTQVQDLLDKIDSMVMANRGSCYTNEMFQEVEEALEEKKARILKEREEQIEREKEELKTKHEGEMEQMRREMQKEKERQAAEQRQKEEQFKWREEQIKREKVEMEQKLREDFEKRREEDDLKMKQRIKEINRETEENSKQLERQREEYQKRRDQEERERRRREEEWKEQQRKQKEKFEIENEEMKKNKEEELKKLQKEYEQRAAEEDRKTRDFEEKIKYAVESKKKELQDLMFSQQQEKEQMMRKEEEKKKELQKDWEKRMAAVSLEQIRKENEYEWQRQKEKEEKDLKEGERKEKEELERRRIENDAIVKIRMMEEQLKLQREKDEKERKKKDEEQKINMEEKLQKQLEEFRKAKEDEKRKHDEEKERNLTYIQEQHKREIETLKKQTEEEARKQAEEEFSVELDEKVKEARAEGFTEGCEKVEQERTRPGRAVDSLITMYFKKKNE